MTILKKAYRLLTLRERRQVGQVLAFSIVVALFEMIGTLSVMPFLAVLADPGQIDDSQALSWLYDRLGYADVQDFLFALGIGSFLLLVISAAMRALGQYVVIRFSQMRAYSISRRLMEGYLRRPYADFLSRHSGEMNHKVLSETIALSYLIYLPLTQIAAQLVLVVTLIGLLVAVDPVVAIVALMVLVGCYAAVYFAVRRPLSRFSQQRFAADALRFRIASETFGGMKTLKLLSRETANLDRFSCAAKQMARSQAKVQTLGELPRFAIEAVAFGGIILLALVLLVRYRDEPGGAVGQLLPLLGLYAFVGYRLMPALQKIYLSLTQIREGLPSLDAISAEFDGLTGLLDLPEVQATPLRFERQVALERIGFRHRNAETPSLQGIDLVLPKGTSLGVVGTTGAGKSTLMDLFLGLLDPQTGRILIDGAPIEGARMRAWQANIGYVPQDIFLVDGSVAENVAFGLSPSEIDQDRVEACARMAQLDAFVREQLPEGYDTEVGERGVRLSGGQRQRVGIARALYHDPEILVFDEATSALDAVTERAVTETIAALSGTKTMLIVAHRINTIRDCDRILVLDRGRMAGLGTYEELYAGNSAFRRLVDARAAA